MSENDSVSNVLTGHLGYHISQETHTLCDVTDHFQPDYVCFFWEKGSKLEISHTLTTPDVDCYNVLWSRDGCEEGYLEDCFSMAGAHWFGGSTVNPAQPSWPLGLFSIDKTPFLAGAFPFSSYQDPFWLTSSGVGIRVSDGVPLYVSINVSGDDLFCLQAKRGVHSAYRQKDNNLRILQLNYTMCTGQDLTLVYQIMNQKRTSLPMDLLPVQNPVWSMSSPTDERPHAVTRERHSYKTSMKHFAENIYSYGMKYSLIFLNDFTLWESSLQENVISRAFENKKTHEVKEREDNLSTVTFTTGMYPYIPLNSHSNLNVSSFTYALKNTRNNQPILTIFNNNVVSYFDLKKQEIRSLLRDSLMQATGYLSKNYVWIPSLEANDLPFGIEFESEEGTNNYGVFATKEICKSHRNLIFTFGRKVNKTDYYYMLQPREISFLNLATTITESLTMSLIGYWFIVPPTFTNINGKCSGMRAEHKTVYITWLKATLLFPVFRLQIPPWCIDAETIIIVKSLLQTRNTLLPHILNATRINWPIIRPLWWHAPEDSIAPSINDEFMVGEHLLVAPQINHYLSRRIYLPRGMWLDYFKDEITHGQQWLEYESSNYTMPIFVRLN